MLNERSNDQAILAEMLSIPSSAYLIELLAAEVDPLQVHQTRERFVQQLTLQLYAPLQALYLANERQGAFDLSAEQKAQRALRNKCLAWMCASQQQDALLLAKSQFENADNMTEQLAAFTCLVNSQALDSTDFVERFYSQWQDDSLVLDKWFSLQAMATQDDTIEVVMSLLEHPKFSIKNPNKVRALLAAFSSNVNAFHGPGGHALLADKVIELNAINPQVAARLVGAFNNWRIFSKPTRDSMQFELQRILLTDELSKDVREIASKALESS